MLVTTQQIILFRLGIIIVTTISEGIHIAEVCGIVGNVQAIFVFNGNNPAPGVVGISCNLLYNKIRVLSILGPIKEPRRSPITRSGRRGSFKCVFVLDNFNNLARSCICY